MKWDMKKTDIININVLFSLLIAGTMIIIGSGCESTNSGKPNELSNKDKVQIQSEIESTKRYITQKVNEMLADHKYVEARKFVNDYAVKSFDAVANAIASFKKELITETIDPSELNFHKSFMANTVDSLIGKNNYQEATKFVSDYNPEMLEANKVKINDFKNELITGKITPSELNYHKSVLANMVDSLVGKYKFQDASKFVRNYNQEMQEANKAIIADYKNELITGKIIPTELKYHVEYLTEKVTNLVNEGKFPEARELIWNYIPEIETANKNEIEKLKIVLLRTKVNTAHFSALQKEITSKIESFIAENNYDNAYVYLNSVGPFPIYTANLSDSLNNVNKALLNIHTAEPETSKIFVSAQKTLYSFFLDSSLAYEQIVKKEEKPAPDLSEFEKRLGEFKDAMALYGCSEDNQNMLVEAIRKDAKSLIEALFVKDKVEESSNGELKLLGTSRMNEKLDEYKQAIINNKLIKAETEFLKSELLVKITALISAKDFAKAREQVWNRRVSRNSKINDDLLAYSIELLNTKINTADYEDKIKRLREETAALVKKNDYKGARDCLASVKPISIYTEIISSALYRIREELVKGISADEKGSDELVAKTEKLLNEIFADNTEIEFAVGEFFKPDTKKLNELIEKFKSVLANYGCSEEQQNRVIDSIEQDAGILVKALFRPVEGEEIEVPKVLGTSQYNVRINKAKEKIEREVITPAQIAFRIAELRALVLPKIENKQYEAARELIHNYGIVGVEGVDKAVAIVKTGIIDVLINPIYADIILPKVKSEVEEAVQKKDFDKARNLVKSLNKVPCYSKSIDEALVEAASFAVISLKADAESCENYVAEIKKHLGDIAGFRRSNETGEEKNEETANALNEKFDALLSTTKQHMQNDDFEKSSIEEWLRSFKDKVLLDASKNKDKCINDWELNKMIDSLHSELDVYVASKLAAEMERQAKEQAKKENNQKAEHDKKMLELAASIAKEAAAQIDFPARAAALKQAAIDTKDENLALVLLEASNLLKKNETGKKISADEATALTVAGAFMGYDDLMNYGVALGAKLDASCPKDKLARSPYLVAIQSNFPGKTADILARADVMRMDANGDNALHYAIRAYNGTVLVSLLIKGVNPNAKGKNGMTPMILASDCCALTFIKALIPYSDVNIQDAKGNTALMRAAARGRLDIVKTLIHGNASTQYSNKNGDNVLEIACETNVVELIRYLINEVKLKPSEKLINSVVSADNVAVMNLIANGENVNASHLITAIENGNLNMIQCLVNLGVDVNAQSVISKLNEIKSICSTYHKAVELAKEMAQIHSLSKNAIDEAMDFITGISDKVPFNESSKSEEFTKLVSTLKEMQSISKISVEASQEGIAKLEKIVEFMVAQGTIISIR